MKVKNITKVVGPMPIGDPFILGAYHYDLYPKGNGHLGPDASLAGKHLGNDFDRQAPWRMYHGKTIPGFPYHPHRGFEIITIAEEGYADHFDSKGSTGRYGQGDVQLMSAGSGVLHGEMFPLINEDKENPLRLFQIWLNLPSASKMTEPQYKMLWNEKIPAKTILSDNGNVKVKIILGQYNGVKSIDPLPYSWAKDPEHHVGVALVELAQNTSYKLDAVSPTMNRFVFFYDGKGNLTIDDQIMEQNFIADLNGGEEIILENGDDISKVLILEGEPINEPIVASGPFVMNTKEELDQAYADFRKTQFGGWPWGIEEKDVVHPKDAERFASYHFDKTIDKPSNS